MSPKRQTHSKELSQNVQDEKKITNRSNDDLRMGWGSPGVSRKNFIEDSSPRSDDIVTCCHILILWAVMGWWWRGGTVLHHFSVLAQVSPMFLLAISTDIY